MKELWYSINYMQAEFHYTELNVGVFSHFVTLGFGLGVGIKSL